MLLLQESSNDGVGIVYTVYYQRLDQSKGENKQIVLNALGH